MRFAAIALASALLSGPSALAWGSKKQGEAPVNVTKPSSAVPGQYLISFEESVSTETRAELFKKWNVKELEKVGSTPLYLIEIPTTSDTEKTLAGLRSGSGVRYVEANLKMQTFGP